MEYLKFKKTKIKKICRMEICVLVGLIVSIFFCFINCFKTTEKINKDVLRLHILANSNDEKDQNLKLKVRDNILKNFSFNNFNNNIEKSKQKIRNELPEIEKIAKETIEQEGFCYNVKAKLENTYFNTREYEGFAMPAGFYDALKIEIGNAKGKNWWCVMVPSLCIPAANKQQDAFLTFNSYEKDLIKKGFRTEIRFATVEFFKKIFC